jgi:Fe-S cluster assembly iron-binding protein IscA
MLQLTPKATEHLRQVRRERGFDDKAGARFVSNGARVGLTFVSTPEPSDRVVDGAGIPVYLAPDVAAAMDESVIDARPEDGKVILVIRQGGSAATGTNRAD